MTFFTACPYTSHEYVNAHSAASRITWCKAHQCSFEDETHKCWISVSRSLVERKRSVEYGTFAEYARAVTARISRRRFVSWNESARIDTRLRCKWGWRTVDNIRYWDYLSGRVFMVDDYIEGPYCELSTRRDVRCMVCNRLQFVRHNVKLYDDEFGRWQTQPVGVRKRVAKTCGSRTCVGVYRWYRSSQSKGFRTLARVGRYGEPVLMVNAYLAFRARKQLKRAR